jgi:large conductance mechanosensitive channel
MGLLSEFKEFALKGNVVDLAVGVIIGAAFGRIVNSVVGDVLMPPIGSLVGGVDFSDLALNLPGTMKDEKTGQMVPVRLRYGAFFQTVLDFVIIAICLFAVIKVMNRLKRKEEAKPPEPTPSEILLAEIRDLMRERR